MGNINSSKIEVKITKPKEINFKFLKQAQHNSMHFIYFIPTSSLQSSNFIIEIKHKNQTGLDNLLIIPIDIDYTKLETYKNKDILYLEHKYKNNDYEIIIRLDKNMILKEIVYKIENKFIDKNEKIFYV